MPSHCVLIDCDRFTHPERELLVYRAGKIIARYRDDEWLSMTVLAEDSK